MSQLAGHAIVDTLVAQGVTHVFGVPGESYLPVLDGLHEYREKIEFITCRQEGGAAFMAEAYAKLTARLGVCMVTRGPGATNASIGVHAAFQDSTPMLLLVGQVGSDVKDREGFQEVDLEAMFAPLAKWAAQVDRADRVPEYMQRAIHTATNGRPGPVVLALPEDVLSTSITQLSIKPLLPIDYQLSVDTLDSIAVALQRAKRPLLLLGGSGWSQASLDGVAAFARQWQLPVACAWRFQSLFNNDDVQYAGEVGLGINPELAQRIKHCDLIIAIGPRLGEVTTGGYELLTPPRSAQQLVHIHADVNELNRVYRADVAAAASMSVVGQQLAGISVPASLRSNLPWLAWTQSARADYELWSKPVSNIPGHVNPSELIVELRRQLSDDAIVTNGAGNFAGWLHRFFQHRQWRTQLAPSSGAMGYGVPAAIAAKIAQPERQVVCVAGDGDFMMNGQELATAMQYGANIVVVLFNNGIYGTIRMHQEMQFPGRVSGSNLHNPDFVALARAYGFEGVKVERTAEFAPALAAALARHDRGTLIEVTIDPEAITARATLSGLRSAALTQKP
jgi:acetolactate synthase-1/2/3 large subunit